MQVIIFKGGMGEATAEVTKPLTDILAALEQVSPAPGICGWTIVHACAPATPLAAAPSQASVALAIEHVGCSGCLDRQVAVELMVNCVTSGQCDLI